MIDEQTMRSWLRRVDEEGADALIQISGPANKFPDFVRYLVKQLKVLLPTMGKVRIAQVLARVGLHLGVTTVGRILKETGPVPEEAATLEVIEPRVVTARRPGDVWHVDLTTVPTGSGFWVPWVPFTLPQSWPFCWWVAVVLDHFSRVLVGFALFVNGGFVCPQIGGLRCPLFDGFRMPLEAARERLRLLSRARRPARALLFASL
jgi:hypothetical protein